MVWWSLARLSTCPRKRFDAKRVCSHGWLCNASHYSSETKTYREIQVEYWKSTSCRTLRPRNPVPDSRTLLVFTKTLRVHIPISTPVRGVSWCVANPIDALDLPNASPTFMLPNLPRMMFYLDLVRRGKKIFVTLQVRAFCTQKQVRIYPLWVHSIYVLCWANIIDALINILVQY